MPFEPPRPADDDSFGDDRGVPEYSSLRPPELLACSSRSDIPFENKQSVLWATVAALLLQWGTVGVSFFIGYWTPAVGLGCRSASYVLYGILGTLVWMCLVASTLTTQAVTLHAQKQHLKEPSVDFSRHGNPGDGRLSRYTGLRTDSMLRAATNILRFCGKSLAFMNALWLISISVLEAAGGYDNCWCRSNYIGLGDAAWVVLFLGGDNLASAARLPWSTGLGVTLTLVLCSGMFFLLGPLVDPYRFREVYMHNSTAANEGPTRRTFRGVLMVGCKAQTLWSNITASIVSKIHLTVPVLYVRERWKGWITKLVEHIFTNPVKEGFVRVRWQCVSSESPSCRCSTDVYPAAL